MPEYIVIASGYGWDWRILVKFRAIRKKELGVYLTVNMPAADSKGAFVWDQSGIRIIGIMQVSVCLGAILIPEYLDSILAILLPGAE